MCCSLKGFKETRKLEDGEFSFSLGNGATVSAMTIGCISLSFKNNKYLLLNDVYFVPDFGKNLLSVARIVEQGYSLNYNNGFEILQGNMIICKTILIENLYYVKPIIQHVYNTNANTDLVRESKRIKMDKTDLTYKWHLRLGHIGLDRINRLVKEGPLESLQVDSLPTCESCLEGKMTKRSFNRKAVRATECLELIHSDVCGPFRIQARGGFEYFATFTDDYSLFGHI